MQGLNIQRLSCTGGSRITQGVAVSSRPVCSARYPQHAWTSPRVLQSSSAGAERSTDSLDQARPAVSEPNPAQPAASSSEQAPTANYDLTIWHYKPWWCQPHTIVATGVAFIVISNLVTEPSIKTTILAASPVMLWWYIFLYMVPKQFKEFAADRIAHHPELQHAPQPGGDAANRE